MLCRAGDITKGDIGAIRIQSGETFAEIREAQVEGFLKSMGSEMVLDDGTKVTRLATPPNIPAGRPSGPRKSGGYEGKRPHRGSDEGYKGKREGGPREGGYKDKKPYGGDKPRDKPRDERSGGDRFERPDRKERSERPRHKAEPREPNAVVSEVSPRSKPAGKPAAKAAPKAESKPSYRAGAGDPGKSWRKDGAGKPGGKRSGPKGPPPPKGKASSKKNRARAAEAKAAKGGGAKPRRPKS